MLNQNKISEKEFTEIQSEYDYIQTLPTTEEVASTMILPLMEEMSERPSVINTCTKVYKQLGDAFFEMKLINNVDSDGKITELESERAIENTPKLDELNQHKDVLRFCMILIDLYSENFPDVITSIEVK